MGLPFDALDDLLYLRAGEATRRADRVSSSAGECRQRLPNAMLPSRSSLASVSITEYQSSRDDAAGRPRIPLKSWAVVIFTGAGALLGSAYRRR